MKLFMRPDVFTRSYKKNSKNKLKCHASAWRHFIIEFIEAMLEQKLIFWSFRPQGEICKSN